jgi:hypothetical protein
MMTNNKEQPTIVGVNEKGVENSNGERMLSGSDNTTTRSFGLTALWSIRKNARTFKIHNRIPRL